MVDNVKKCAEGNQKACFVAKNEESINEMHALEVEKLQEELQGALNGADKKYSEADVDEMNKKLNLDFSYYPDAGKLQKSDDGKNYKIAGGFADKTSTQKDLNDKQDSINELLSEPVANEKINELNAQIKQLDAEEITLKNASGIPLKSSPLFYAE